MVVIDLNSKLYHEILNRSQTINNLIDDINELNEIDDNDNKVNTIVISDEYEEALKYLELEKIEGERLIDLVETKYVKILIDRLKLYNYLDMDKEYDIKPLAKYIGEKIEKNLYYYVGDLIDFVNDEYIGLIDYDILYIIIDNHPILHVYKELENFNISETLYNKIFNNIPTYVTVRFHKNQSKLFSDYSKYLSKQYFEILRQYNILDYIKYHNEKLVKYLIDNDNYKSDRMITYNTNYVISVNENTRDVHFKTETLSMDEWYEIIYHDYCSETSYDIFIYIKDEFSKRRVRLYNYILLNNSAKKGNYNIVKYICNHIINEKNIVRNTINILLALYETASNFVANEDYLKIIDELLIITVRYNIVIDTMQLLIKSRSIVLLDYLFKKVHIDQLHKNYLLCLYLIYNYNIKYIILLINHGANVKDIDVENKGNTSLHYISNALYFIGKDNCPRPLFRYRNTLHGGGYYCTLVNNNHDIENKIRIAKFLIDAGENVNAINNKQQTPLMLACKNNMSHLIKIYVENGANVNYVNNNYETALTYAIKNYKNSLENIKYLINNKANINIPNNSHNNPLLLSISENLPKVQNLLFSYNVDINAVDENNNNALMYINIKIMRKDSYSLIKYLIENNIDVFIINNFRQTIITNMLKIKRGVIRTRRNQMETYLLHILKLYISKGVDINIPDNIGKTALMYAIERRFFEIAEFLINEGADINIADNNGQTPLMIAKNILPTSEHIVDILINRGAENI